MTLSSDLSLAAAATPSDIARLRSFIVASDHAGERDLDRHLAQSRYRPALTRVAERAGALVGYALLHHRRRRLGLATIETGVIERIGVPAGAEDFATLIGDCLGVLLEQGLPLATLYGDRTLYTPFGFAPYRFQAQIELRAHGATPHDGLRPASADDLADLAALYAANYHDLALAEDRAPPDWRAWLLAGPVPLALEDGHGRVVAYAQRAPAALGEAAGDGHGRGNDRFQIGEAAAADAGAARTLIAALQRSAESLGLRALALALPPSHPVVQAALHLGGVAQINATPDHADRVALAGVIDLVGMLEALTPELERRLARSRYAGWSGNLRIEIATERITLALDSGRAAVIDGSRPADVRLRQLALPALAQLCLGYRAAADLRATGGLACDDSALGLIDALFPAVMPFVP